MKNVNWNSDFANDQIQVLTNDEIESVGGSAAGLGVLIGVLRGSPVKDPRMYPNTLGSIIRLMMGNVVSNSNLGPALIASNMIISSKK